MKNKQVKEEYKQQKQQLDDSLRNIQSRRQIRDKESRQNISSQNVQRQNVQRENTQIENMHRSNSLRQNASIKNTSQQNDRQSIQNRGSRQSDRKNKQQTIKQILESIKSKDTNLYNHISNTIKKIILSQHRDSYDLFQYYTLAQQNEGSKYQIHQDSIININQFFNHNAQPTEEQSELPTCGYVPNLMEESKWYEKAGIGFGEQSTYLIFKSLEKLAIDKQTKQIKLWGKILCSEKDYYIVQCPAEAGDEEELAADVQPKGTGINRMTYWVTTDLFGEWKQLPIITPTQLTISRQIKYQFTGDLDRNVFLNPFFPGKEAHLLKCQIVRISFTCEIVPRTMYTVNADDPKEIEPTEEWKMPNFQFLSHLNNWVHQSQNILKNGRLTLLKPEIPEDAQVDEEKLMKDMELKDPTEQRLKPLNYTLQGGGEAWVLKIIGDCTQYRALSRVKDIKNLVWKGWTLIYHNKHWSRIYIGNGMKSNKEWYYPKQPQMVLIGQQDHIEQPEPNYPPQIEKIQQIGEAEIENE